MAGPKQHEYKKFQFTRHLLSCNNISAGKIYGYKTDYEPSATLYGIVKTIEFANNAANIKAFTSNKVYVSNLIRTWITAFLLYGVRLVENNSPETLQLCISPFLKEHKTSKLGKLIEFERGNYPKEIRKAVAKFLKFLNRLNSIVKEVDSKHTIYCPTTVVLNLPGDVDIKEIQKITFRKKLSGYGYVVVSDMDEIIDTVGPTAYETFLVNGDLNHFMAWFDNSERNYYYDGSNEEPIRVVTHSKVMKSYFKKLDLTGSIEVKTNGIPINKTNVWRFTTSQFGHPADIEIGLQQDKDPAITLEQQFPKLSLCGTSLDTNEENLIDIGFDISKLLLGDQDTINKSTLEAIEYGVRELNIKYDKYIIELHKQYRFSADTELTESNIARYKTTNEVLIKRRKIISDKLRYGTKKDPDIDNPMSTTQIDEIIKATKNLYKTIKEIESGILAKVKSSYVKGVAGTQDANNISLIRLRHLYIANIELLLIYLHYAKSASEAIKRKAYIGNMKTTLRGFVYKLANIGISVPSGSTADYVKTIKTIATETTKNMV